MTKILRRFCQINIFILGIRSVTEVFQNEFWSQHPLIIGDMLRVSTPTVEITFQYNRIFGLDG